MRLLHCTLTRALVLFLTSHRSWKRFLLLLLRRLLAHLVRDYPLPQTLPLEFSLQTNFPETAHWTRNVTELISHVDGTLSRHFDVTHFVGHRPRGIYRRSLPLFTQAFRRVLQNTFPKPRLDTHLLPIQVNTLAEFPVHLWAIGLWFFGPFCLYFNTHGSRSKLTSSTDNNSCCRTKKVTMTTTTEKPCPAVAAAAAIVPIQCGEPTSN